MGEDTCDTPKRRRIDIRHIQRTPAGQQEKYSPIENPAMALAEVEDTEGCRERASSRSSSGQCRHSPRGDVWLYSLSAQLKNFARKEKVGNGIISR